MGFFSLSIKTDNIRREILKIKENYSSISKHKLINNSVDDYYTL